MNQRDRIKQSGKELYMMGLQSQDIARILGVSATTVSTWTSKEGWREERAAKLSQKRTIQDRILDLIDYQLEALNERVLGYRTANPDELPLLDKGEIDALSKMFAVIKGRELQWATVVDIVREFAEHVHRKDADLAKALVPYSDDFLQLKRDLMTN
ncbi:terminase gpP N-terminus-related DNA-binding protein [Larkinella sp. VNQ87]|uniref:terminase gpP N-terminus-related DNA-binding protein n=1 Tax=Larkinella sp. VNQ87 TaxID=3400921 RepID=UPI003C06594E